MTQSQKDLFDSIDDFLDDTLDSLDTAASAALSIPNDLSAKDKKFLSDLADQLKLVVSYDEFTDDGVNFVTVAFDPEMIKLAREEVEEDDENRVSTEEEDGDESSEAEEIGIVHLNLNGQVERMARKNKEVKQKDGSEWQQAIKRVLKKYEKAEVAKEFNEEEFEQQMEKEIQDKMVTWKADYYKVRGSVAPPSSSRQKLLTRVTIFRKNSNSTQSRNRKRSTISRTDTSKVFNGSCTTITKVSQVGDGSTTTTTPRR